jgi:DNA polymerase III subunit gamma/tau
MNLIAQRPSAWMDIVGQQRALDVIHAVLRHQNFLTRGIILHGPLGVGKTTTAYLLAKALMCVGPDPLGCGECPSCASAAEGIDTHPDFVEIDGAVKSGVEAARDTVEAALSLPILGKRKVTVIDEAQFLSPEAWGAYLKVLEQGNTDAVFIFVSNEAERIKMTTSTRCIRVPFERVGTDTLRGHLAKIATANGINYEQEALDIIARHSKGIVREATQCLNMAAAMGIVKPDLVRTVIDQGVEEKTTDLLKLLAKKDQVGACKLADELTLSAHPQKIVETMLSLYGRAIWQEDDGTGLGQIYAGLPNVGAVTDILVKWSAMSLPADVLPIIVFELLQTQAPKSLARTVSATAHSTPRLSATVVAPPAPKRTSLAAFLDGEAI